VTTPARPWRRASRGLLVMGFGTFLLLNTTGNLPWSFWLRLLPLWPVCLIAIGLRLVFERSRLPIGILLSPVLLLGTMSWVAAAGPPVTSWEHGSLNLRAERPPDVQRWTLEGNLAYGVLDLTGRPLPGETLVAGEATGGRGTPRLRASGGRSLARVRFWQNEHHTISILGEEWSGWRLRLAEDLPVAVDLEMALAEGNFDLSTVPVTGIDIDGAFNSLALRLGVPERDVVIRLEGAFTGYHLQVPEGVPVRVQTDGVLNVISGSRGGPGPGYRIRLRGAFNHLDIDRLDDLIQPSAFRSSFSSAAGRSASSS